MYLNDLRRQAVSVAVTPALAAFVASERVRQRPFGLYRLLQRIDPVHVSPLGIVVVSSHRDVAGVLRNAAFGSDETKADTADLRIDKLGRLLGGSDGPGGASSRQGAPFHEVVRNLMLFKDPPDHTRLRSLVAKAFTPKRVEGLAGRVGEIVDELLTPALERRHLEVMTELAYPLPARVVCELLGVPDGDHDLFVRHAPALATALDPSPMRSQAGIARADEATAELRSYLDGLIEERRRQPRDDLLSALLAAEDDGATLTHDELVATVLLLLLAGHETTANVLGNSMLRLVGDPSAWAAVAGCDDAGMRAAVEELLRLDGPVQMAERITLEPVECGGVDLPRGKIVILMLAAANRDPHVFDHPHRFVVDRSPNPHLAFGAGAHFCIGAPLARLELRVVLRELIHRLPPTVRLDGPARWRPSFTIRGLSELTLAW